MSPTPTDPNQAQAWISGEAPDQTIDFYIPRGNTGLMGPQGPIGPSLAVGTIETITGPAQPGIIGAQGIQGVKGDPGGIVGGTTIGTENLNTIIAPGVYRRTATGTSLLALNYPSDTDSGVLTVFERVAGTTVFQTWYSFAPSAGAGAGGYFYRSMNSAASWTSWRFMAGQRIDQTAGRVVYTWDHLNAREQLVWGDTGWRAVALDPTYGVAAAGNFYGRPLGGGEISADAVLLRRINHIVYVGGMGALQPKQDYSTSARNLILLPVGFRSSGSGETLICKYGNNGGDAGQKLVYVLPGATYANPPTLQVTPLLDSNWSGSPTGQAYPKNYHGIWLSGSYTTPDPWPTTLPGVASGTIPNL